ncbi:MAG: AMP-binding protein [Dermatophilaceae bacterium]
MPTGPRVLDALGPLAAALAGSGPPLVPYAADAPPPALPPTDGTALPADLALVVSTSGSTGDAKRVLLTTDNVLASAGAAHEVLSGPGAWLLALPAYHIGGLQVLVRAVLGTGEPTILDLARGFTAEAFVMAARRMPPTSGPAYVSLVPTQIARLLDDRAAVEVLGGFDAVLCGGAATSAALRERARANGVSLVLTYGMSETAGGCVYDGMPLPVAEVHIDNERHVVLGGLTVGHGYLGLPALTSDRFVTDADDVRWFRTDDLGHLDRQGRLQITGRADDLINTGGFKVAPGSVEDALVRFVPGVRDAVVVAVPDPEWGQVVAAAVIMVPVGGGLDVHEVRSALRGILPDHALPRMVRVVEAFPVVGPGKPDRWALRLAFGERIGRVSPADARIDNEGGDAWAE